ncbi:flagellin [Natrarchaeobaculum aegyptiacum]|uniref:Flagellin n=1 Tax=Natrarchaeobaculum aegyptiacum TaxID=745377 RepID=A0A2Z2HPJ6_9EURY|nr:flagellin [Natrarchaeobaculum aegyptiacum]ARS88966.1 flagellin [Natrarchaeobaculum aegyptiacum]
MSSVSSTHLIMFIGSLLIATAVAGTVVVEVGSMSDAIEVRGSSVAEDIETDFVIISDESQSESIVEDGSGNVTLLVKNVGSTTIPAESGKIDVIVDGSHTIPDDVRLLSGGGGDWEPGAVVELTMETERSFDGDTTVVVIVGSNEDSITTYVDNGDGD